MQKYTHSHPLFSHSHVGAHTYTHTHTQTISHTRTVTRTRIHTHNTRTHFVFLCFFCKENDNLNDTGNASVGLSVYYTGVNFKL